MSATTPEMAYVYRDGVGEIGNAVVATRSVVAAAVAGNALEFYDFVIYAFSAVYIGKSLFPEHTAYVSLLMSVGVFGIGFLARPLGGVVFGLMGDRVGRRASLIVTIVLMTAGTLGVALTPSFSSIGIAAPVIVVIARLLQGLALGGEIGPSSAFLVESAPAGKRGLYASWQLGSQGAGILVAGLMGVLFSRVLSHAAMLAWGWRVPFLIGLLIVPLAVYMRRAMPETLHARPSAHTAPSRRASKAPGKLVIIAVGVILGGTVSTYVGNYMTTYAITTLKMPAAVAMGATVAVGLFTLVFSIVGGWLCDRYGRKPIMVWPRVVAAVATVPAFLLLNAVPTALTLVLVSAFLAALTAISGAASLVAIPEAFARRHRALGLGVAYAVGVSIFGGTTQFIITWLIRSEKPRRLGWGGKERRSKIGAVLTSYTENA
ncbi:MFS transporter [Thiomonas sp. FB-Cd]|uniref:MFS transporter n=1 Tax=Thiomonas sp. FB-Cd TaxID=1158292 RepID=UPI0009DDDB16|nr:MFS transporter [Thiomonas sp. FB-Cd]